MLPSVLHVALADGTFATVSDMEQFIQEENLQNKTTNVKGCCVAVATITTDNAQHDDHEGHDEDHVPNTPESNSRDSANNKCNSRDKASDEDEEEDEDYVATVETEKTVTVAYNATPVTLAYHLDLEENEFDDIMVNCDCEGRSLQNGVRSWPKPQPPFAPAATPLNLARQILCWNYFGIVTVFREDCGDSASNIVTIERADVVSQSNRSSCFTDTLGFVLGSLGEEGAVFTTDVMDGSHGDDDCDAHGEANIDSIDCLKMSEHAKAMVKKIQWQSMTKSRDRNKKQTGSRIYFRRFETFASAHNKDWCRTLPDGELVLGCACGQGWVAVATR